MTTLSKEELARDQALQEQLAECRRQNPHAAEMLDRKIRDSMRGNATKNPSFRIVPSKSES